MEAGDGRGGGGRGGEEEEQEQEMSEMHLGCPPGFSGLYISRFGFSSRPLEPSGGGGDDERGGGCELIAATSSSCDSPDAVAVDEDGDLKEERKIGEEVRIMCSPCSMVSPRRLGASGFRFALLLTDFVLHKSFTSSDFNGVTAIEIGAGTGLVGLAQARVGRRIFITDRGTDILDNCLANVRLYSSMLKFDEAKVCVRELDWKLSWPPPVGTCDRSDPRYLWSTSEIEEAEKATILFAADVIYSDDLTDLFF